MSSLKSCSTSSKLAKCCHRKFSPLAGPEPHKLSYLPRQSLTLMDQRHRMAQTASPTVDFLRNMLYILWWGERLQLESDDDFFCCVQTT